ncbi:NAD(P)-dependent oxidoreductase [Candidatus Roizmanbacteria bacterium]|nr:NAD(P)-dependent oxidoreductase [Candidatus Roizmanbacteria bacterium]
MKVLVTGGAGFLGLHVAQGFARHKDVKIVLLDIAPYTKEEYPRGVEFVAGDVRDATLVNRLLKGVDVVIHGAAALPLCSPAEIHDTNVNGTENMLFAAHANKTKRFIYISSTAVYGVPKKHPVYEDDPVVGVGPYGHSKIEAEKLCQKYRSRGLVVSIIRPKTFVGTHRLGVFEILFDWIKDGKKIPMVGSGTNRYQLMDVEDLVNALYLCASAPDEKKVNDTFNVGAEKFDTVREDLQQVFDFAKSGSKIMPVPATPVKLTLFLLEKMRLSPLYQWVYDTADKDSFVSIDKIKKKLGWEPKSSNGEALIKAYKWYLENYIDVKSRPAGTTHTVGWKQGALGIVKRFM